MAHNWTAWIRITGTVPFPRALPFCLFSRWETKDSRYLWESVFGTRSLSKQEWRRDAAELRRVAAALGEGRAKEGGKERSFYYERNQSREERDTILLCGAFPRSSAAPVAQRNQRIVWSEVLSPVLELDFSKVGGWGKTAIEARRFGAPLQHREFKVCRYKGKEKCVRISIASSREALRREGTSKEDFVAWMISSWRERGDETVVCNWTKKYSTRHRGSFRLSNNISLCL